jgi:hypothetical protein
VSLVLIALALGFATMIMDHVSSAAHWERFISYLQQGFIYAVGHAIFRTVVFAVPFCLARHARRTQCRPAKSAQLAHCQVNLV